MKTTVLSIFAIFLINGSLLHAQCEQPIARANLTANNIKAGLLSGGDGFWDLSNAVYEYPAGSDKHLLFANSLWMAGRTASGELRGAAQTYRQDGTDYYAGPISNDIEAICDNFDNLWTVTSDDIETYLQAWQMATGDLDEAEIPESILEWPGRSSATFSAFELPANQALAPFWDADGDARYDPRKGDYPVIDETNPLSYADQMTWWIFNDLGGTHQVTGAQPLKMQVAVMAYAYATDDYLNNTTFYKYTLRYYGEEELNDFYSALWIDPDLGEFDDDYVGCNPAEKMGFAYNGTGRDALYGDEVPVVGVKYLSDWYGNTGSDIRFSSFTVYNNDVSDNGNPENGEQYYNYLSGFWRDGSPIYAGGDGTEGTEVTTFMYSDDPAAQEGWSECTLSNTPGDRRFVMSMGPFDIQPGQSGSMTFAVLVSPAESNLYPCPDLAHLTELGQAAEAFYEDQSYVGATNVVESEQINLQLYPNPASTKVQIECSDCVESLTLIVYNYLGQSIAVRPLSQAALASLDVSQYKAGMYLYELRNQEGDIVKTGKLMIE